MTKRTAPSRTKAFWTCPVCKRKFAKRRQWHSCLAQDFEVHFRGKNPNLRKLYDLLIRRLRESGPLRVDAVKTSINLISRHHFGGIGVRSNYLRVGFLAEEPIHHPRIVHSQRLGPNRVGQSVILRSADDIDDTLLVWLRNAQTLQS